MNVMEEAILAMAERTDYRRCNVGQALRAMNSTEREQFEQVFATPAIYHTVIVELLTRRGVKTNDKSVKNHRQQKCGCNHVTD